MGLHKDSMLSYPYFKQNPYYKALIQAAFLTQPPFEQLNKKGQQKFAADVTFAAQKAMANYQANEAIVREATRILIMQLEALAAEEPRPEGGCCVIL